MTNDVGAITAMLMKNYHVPRSVIMRLREAYANEGMINSDTMRYDRILTAMALSLVRCFGFGAGRVFRALDCFDKIATEAQEENGGSWPALMAELDQKTGIVVQSDPNRFIAEYRGRDWRRQLEILAAEEKMKEETE